MPIVEDAVETILVSVDKEIEAIDERPVDQAEDFVPAAIDEGELPPEEPAEGPEGGDAPPKDEGEQPTPDGGDPPAE